MTSVPDKDPFGRFRQATPARIGLGRAGDAVPTGPLLQFGLAHALARDAVHGQVNWNAVRAQLTGPQTIMVASAAPDRATYLRRPDLGRRLADEDGGKLQPSGWDFVLVIGDGLSAAAVQSWAAPTANAILSSLAGWRIGPVVLADRARVALGDDIGARMGAAMTAVLIGERPGLSVANSLGIYLTLGPRIGRRDSERNCISNIHADGLSPEQAAQKLIWLARQARVLGATGVTLKDETPVELTAPATALTAKP